MTDALPGRSGSIVVLDGGMGKELARIGAPFRQPEWSALALLEDPPTVADAHRNFVDAGADVIIANTYAVVPYHLGEELFAERATELADLAGRLARQVADEAERPIRVAASLPPLFGSYTPEHFDPERAPELWRILIEAQAPWVDLWLVETIGSCAEGEAAADALDRAEAVGERWFAYSLAGEPTVEGSDEAEPVLWSGESVAEAAEVAIAGRASAILLNCAGPELIAAALPPLVAAARAADPAPAVGAYANGFPPKPTVYSANSVILDRREDLTPARYAELTQDWIDLGATIVGGCCGIHPEHIEAVARVANADARPLAGLDDG